MNQVQEYQKALQEKRQAELEAEKAKTLAKVYADEINKILMEENVTSIPELVEKFNEEVSKLNTLTETYKKDVEAWNQAKAKLIAAGVFNG